MSGLLLTGGTGFLGMSFLARLLEDDDGPEIFVLVRARDEVEADSRVAATLARLYLDPPRGAARIRAVPADLEQPRLGLSPQQRATLVAHVDRVVHSAASISFTLPLADARRINVAGTRAVMELARELDQLERFVHVSTAYVSGRLPGVFRESDPGGSGFRNTYEWSKTEAEIAVAMAADLPWVIVRPSIVVGDSRSGWTSAFNVLYWPLQAFARGLLEDVPADPHGVVDVVPVDYVVDVLERATFTPGLGGRFHAVAGENALSVDQLVEIACGQMGRRKPRYTPASAVPPDHPASVFAPYFDVATRFDDRRTRWLMGERVAPDPAEYLPRLLAFAKQARWGKRPLSLEAARQVALQTASA